MKSRLRKWRRDWLRDRVISAGVALRNAQVARAGVSSTLYPHDTAYLDAKIDRLERRHRRLLTQFKEA